MGERVRESATALPAPMHAPVPGEVYKVPVYLMRSGRPRECSASCTLEFRRDEKLQPNELLPQ